jgi:pimeloyl-ACP methyl ester carboxylesterase
MVYLEGGPGFGNRQPGELPLTNQILDKGYQLLYLDYRGTGLSTPLNAKHLKTLGDVQAQADYLKLFRQDNIVRDLEAVRQCLATEDNWPEEGQQWSIFGQSFGGFVSLTYLSTHPGSLRECFLTGGLAPIQRTPEEVYEATFKKVIQRNEAYYKKFPEDVAKVRQVIEYIAIAPIPLPAGGFLTVPRFLALGIAFGMHGGLNSVHTLVLRMVADLDQFGFFTRPTLNRYEQTSAFDVVPIYAILHEAIYCYRPGIKSDWAAAQVASRLKKFSWIEKPENIPADQPLYFTGEMVFPSHFQSFPELKEMQEAAWILAQYDKWEDLYNLEQLTVNKVPVFAASFIEDMYVDFNLAKETASVVQGVKVYETNDMYHNALRSCTDQVINALFRMRDDPID